MTLQEIVDQLRACQYECEAGALENNVAFVELESLALRQQPHPEGSRPQPPVGELLSCPFCGSEAQITEHKSTSLRTVYMVSCVACEDECSKQSHDKEQAIAAWNRRVPQPRPQAVPSTARPLPDEVREAAAFALRCMDYQQPESGIKLKHKRTLRTWLAAQPSAPA